MSDKKFKVIIEKELEEFWGMDDLYEDIGDDEDEFQKYAVEVLLEDPCALLDGAKYRVEQVPQVDWRPEDHVYHTIKLLSLYDASDMLFWGLDIEGKVVPMITTNDLFEWATVDACEVEPGDLPELKRALDDCFRIDAVLGPIYGCYLFAARKEKCRPQNCCYPKNKDLWPLFDACGPERPDDKTVRPEAKEKRNER